MLPNEREYRVGPKGFMVAEDGKGDAPNVTVTYEPGALVWLRGVPPDGADLAPTGRERKYETKSIWDQRNTSIRVTYPEDGAYPSCPKAEYS